MIGYQLTETDKALIEHFHTQSNARGFDGVYSLEPTERGLMAVADLVRQQTILQVFAALNLKGEDAAKLWFGLRRHDVPATDRAARQKLEAILNAK